jgi:multiple sugar transport system substrate-binding protein
MLEQISAKFADQHPDIKVSIEPVPRSDYVTKLETSIVGGSGPDVFWNALPDRFLDLARLGLIENLSDWMQDDPIDLSPIAPRLLGAFTYEGSLYAIPKDFDTVGLWYNKALFDAKGVAYPDDTWTWETFRDAAKKLTDPANNVYGFVVNPGTRAGYYNFIAQNSGEIITDDHRSGFDMPETIEAIQFMHDLIHVDKVSPTVQQSEEIKPETRFQAGGAAMILDGSWRARALVDDPNMVANARVAVLPMGKVRASSSGTIGYSIYSGSKHKQEAWALVKFLASPEAALVQASTGTVIPSQLDQAQVWVDSIPAFQLGAFVEMADYAEVVAHSFNTPEWDQPTRRIVKNALAGDVSVAEAAQQITKLMNDVLAAEPR